MHSSAPVPDPETPLALARAALERPGSPFRALPARFALVDVGRQRLVWFEDARALREYPVSTAAAGVGGASGSNRTPPGWHRIHARIGAGEPAGRVFESRVATPRVWGGEALDDDLILTRVLTLEGLEDGVNRGPDCDSLARYIYVHGTNHPDTVGRPESHGCIRMRDPDLLDLFERAREGDALVVVEGIPRGLA